MKQFLFAVSFALCVPLSSVAQRPAESSRSFTSPAVVRCIEEVGGLLQDPQLRQMFVQCFPNTLDTTVDEWGRDDTFIITGDIPALWLRDSAAQVWPYLRFAAEDKSLADLVRGLLRRQFRCICLDPYANAFMRDPSAPSSHWQDDGAEMRPGVFERKYELNSLCYPLRLACGYWRATGDVSLFDDLWLQTVRAVLSTMREQQRYAGMGPYRFLRRTDRMHDTQSNWGYGHPARPCGLIASAFRASDDATIFPFLVPDNFMVVSTLRSTAEVLQKVNSAWPLADSCRSLAADVEGALRRCAVVETDEFGAVYAYEVDGYGSCLLMDDANVPSLLSLPYISDVPLSDSIYQHTRRMVLSRANPYYFSGSAGAGIGGPHVGPGFVWPMSIIMQAMTSTDDAEIAECLRTLLRTDAGTGFMHEAFLQDDAQRFTRPWFAWANTLFGELILKLVDSGKLELLNNLKKEQEG